MEVLPALELTAVVPRFPRADLLLDVPVLDDLAIFEAEDIEDREIIVADADVAVGDHEAPLPDQVANLDVLDRLAGSR